MWQMGQPVGPLMVWCFVSGARRFVGKLTALREENNPGSRVDTQAGPARSLSNGEGAQRKVLKYR
jgi:hypothetical protein